MPTTYPCRPPSTPATRFPTVQDIHEFEILERLRRGRSVYTTARNAAHRAKLTQKWADYRFWRAIQRAAGTEQIILMKELEKIRFFSPETPPTTPMSD